MIDWDLSLYLTIRLKSKELLTIVEKPSMNPLISNPVNNILDLNFGLNK
jgi:hypothetical protein